MAWWNGWLDGSRRRSRGAHSGTGGVQSQLEPLLDELEEARRDWKNAHRHFEHAVGKDQIDYAIFAIEAAEKRYEMLLRRAKAMSLQSGLAMRAQKRDEEAG
ncbi:DUF2508 family protein [Paenibacillus sp. IB182496]|uniref:DUF2508 family protein n=1 Tax=Paenibacillus sabuli TaxID=2772509 RepID=A0A927BRU3_9BACL|nr:DUF2508 family protein [Paenibacillus sabuli]MBD2845608.1 DUF2508 family protein [Paenibacillus sabuli]